LGLDGDPVDAGSRGGTAGDVWPGNELLLTRFGPAKAFDPALDALARRGRRLPLLA
jgi:hypothetical protein